MPIFNLKKTGGGSQLIKTQSTCLNFRNQRRRILNNLSCVQNNLLDRLQNTCPISDEQRPTNQIYMKGKQIIIGQNILFL